ncbi:MAG: response regulator transcription factor [Chloroflexi bacterium]|nr:response regulator transcription factor [Chloroflexota bacterium]MCH8235779.1 response regulator transcription factor [Chloroflexota bacterium]MCH8817570.1 response regulator transcription factor [Chloroflexota bacterium]
MKALIIDDDPDIQEVVALCLEVRWPDIEVETASDGRSGLDAVKRSEPDIVILDLGLPDLDGLTVCEEIREDSNVPVLILSVRDREVDVVRGLNAGADDYVTKPFSQMQFLARVGALLRRTAADQDEDRFEDNGLVVDMASHEVTLHDVPVKLTPTEFNMLTHLVRNADRIVSHQSLLEKVWGREYIDATDYLKSHIQHLRQKLGESADEATRIVNERGVGYRFVTSRT